MTKTNEIENNASIANEKNFYTNTEATFTLAEKPKQVEEKNDDAWEIYLGCEEYRISNFLFGRKADYSSGSQSEYWYTEEGVYRYSNHWGKEIASCDWYLEGVSEDGDLVKNTGWFCGFCAWEDFKLKDKELHIYSNGKHIDTVNITFDMIEDGYVNYKSKSVVFKLTQLMSIDL